MNDMQKSELVIAKILNLLMQWGIQETELTFMELELDESFENFFFPCVSWLKNEGIMRSGEVHRMLGGPAEGLIMTPVLTSYGMSLLGEQIQLGDAEKTIAESVKDVSEGNVDYNRIGDAIGGILGGFTKSISS